MCGCKSQIGMAKRKSKSVNLSMEDLLFAGAGAVAALALNPLLGKALESQSDSTKNMINNITSPAKALGGGYLAMNKKMDRKLRFAGIGIAAAGAIELGVKYAPEGTLAIAGTGDVFDMIGAADVLELPIAPSAPLENSSYGDSRAILGTDVYAEDRVML